ncbi:putative transcriptional regulator [Enterococcus sp. PF1-24]|uniref:HTH domain-containing protein n=1 Tax=unclassified Enterococcus TaxID=2608891 RepID=UPI002476FD79|nr:MULTISPECIES: HTH domain-containing protein [unclassified Enterococcus]MDH6364540.1 putative transcriptional regulator [Enterococcus sp. PFB1-1]MDH6401583.1 putative transcriptional regulator [Enterococcus sp. PF1-24]
MEGNVTVRELAEELNVSKQAVRKWLLKLPEGLSTTMNKNRLELSCEVADFIRQNIKNGKKLPEVIEDKSYRFDENIEFFKEQLKMKDDQIKKLHFLLEQQQQLYLDLKKEMRLSISKTSFKKKFRWEFWK